MDTTTRALTVAVEITDPDLDADVRAVLAALAMEPGTGPADVLVTDRAAERVDRDGDRASGAGGAVSDAAAGRVGTGGSRVVRVGSDRDPGDDDEVIRLPSGTGDLVGVLLAPVPTRAGAVVVVVGAVGGCGASTLAAAMAVRAAPSHRTLLVETDPHGTGVDLLLGTEDHSGLRVEDVRADLGGPDPDALWGAAPEVLPGLRVLARSRSRPADADPAPAPDGGPGAVRAHRAGGGLAVSDSGGSEDCGPVRDEADLVVVVTRADLQGAVAARRAVRRSPGAALVIRTGRGDPLHAADVAGSVGAQRWHVLPEIGSVRRAAGAGELADALRRGRAGGMRRLCALADTLLGEVGAGER